MKRGEVGIRFPIKFNKWKGEGKKSRREKPWWLCIRYPNIKWKTGYIACLTEPIARRKKCEGESGIHSKHPHPRSLSSILTRQTLVFCVAFGTVSSGGHVISLRCALPRFVRTRVTLTRSASFFIFLIYLSSNFEIFLVCGGSIRPKHEPWAGRCVSFSENLLLGLHSWASHARQNGRCFTSVQVLSPTLMHAFFIITLFFHERPAFFRVQFSNLNNNLHEFPGIFY